MTGLILESYEKQANCQIHADIEIFELRLKTGKPPGHDMKSLEEGRINAKADPVIKQQLTSVTRTSLLHCTYG